MEAALHFLIPFLIALGLGLELKKAFFLSLFALVPDLDFLIWHRVAFHSPIVLVAFSVVGLGLAKVFDVKHLKYAYIASLMLFSHFFFDMFTGFGLRVSSLFVVKTTKPVWCSDIVLIILSKYLFKVILFFNIIFNVDRIFSPIFSPIYTFK